MSGKSYQYLLEFKDMAMTKIQKLSRESGTLERKTRAVGQEMTRTEHRSRSLGSEFGRTSTKGSMLSSMFGGLKGQIASFITVTALLAGTSNLSRAAADFEQTTIAFETMLGSAERSKKTIRDLNEFSNVTPFTNDQVFKASKSLLAYNIQAEELIPTLTSLGNISAGVGVEKLPQLILAFGQVKAATRLTGMELRQFTEAGVPLLDELSKVTGKTVATIKEDLIPGGKISFDAVRVAMANMSKEGGKFFNLMDRQSATFGGRISTLQGKVGLLSVAYGTGLNKFVAPAIEGVIGVTDRLLMSSKSLSDQYYEQKKRTEGLITTTKPLIARYEELTTKARLNKDEQTELKSITQRLAEAMPSAVTEWNKYGEAISLATGKMRENLNLSKEALKLKNADAIADAQREIFNANRQAAFAQGKLNQIARNGGFIWNNNAGKTQFSEEQMNKMREKIVGITGKNGLVEALEQEIKKLSGEDTTTDPLGGSSTGVGTAIDGDIKSGIEGITAGGTKNVSINFQGGIKFAENIDISVEQLQDGLDQLEPQMREFFVRLLSGGLHTATGQ